ncbi:hypothetical protein AU255_16400 [Methyloprofundus sedimenti]|uniref:Cytochrome c domain-containing protein n=1 Tax=Methyloprofundus sedimenti TaxID=1420851 RepID=A0A1V8M2Q7_9GAMM|nr:cytochrome c [Methyloprofundus sedimenti]OQK15776.1 hypothetical protein AU255_16400 [Methyloprofundus sedimenti]
MALTFFNVGVMATSVVNAPGADTETKVSTKTLQIDIPSLIFGADKYKAKLGFRGRVNNEYTFGLEELIRIPDTEVKGKVLYEKTCALCHTIGGSSSTKSISSTDIFSAMLQNLGGMGQLDLTDEEIEEIAAYLNSITSTPTPVTTVQIGQNLYDKNCLACHAINSSAFLASKNSSSIFSAILNDLGGMGKLNKLSPSDEDAIADYVSDYILNNP